MSAELAADESRSGSEEEVEVAQGSWSERSC